MNYTLELVNDVLELIKLAILIKFKKNNNLLEGINKHIPTFCETNTKNILLYFFLNLYIIVQKKSGKLIINA